MIDASYNAENKEHGQEANHAVHDVGKFHVAGIGDFLADLNGEGDDDDNGEYVDPGDDHFVVMLGKMFEQGIDHEDHGHSKQADDQKMHLLVCEIYFVCVIQMHEIVVDLRDDADAPVKKSFHNSSFPLWDESCAFEKFTMKGTLCQIKKLLRNFGVYLVTVDFLKEKTYNYKKRMGE